MAGKRKSGDWLFVNMQTQQDIALLLPVFTNRAKASGGSSDLETFFSMHRLAVITEQPITPAVLLRRTLFRMRRVPDPYFMESMV